MNRHAATSSSEKDKPGYTQFLHDLLDVEVKATDVEVKATDERRPATSVRRVPQLKTLEELASPSNPRSIASSSTNSPSCGSSRRRPICC